MSQTARGLASSVHWPRGDAPFEQCRGCSLRGSQLCRIIHEDPHFGTHPPVLRHFERGQRIIGNGDSNSFLGVIRRGFARRSVIKMSGKRVLVGLAMPGDIVGGIPGRDHGYDFEAATDIEICSHESAVIKRQLSANHSFRRLILREIDNQHHRLLGWLWRNGTLNSRERIIAFLVKSAEFMPTEPLPDGSLVLNMEIERGDWADLTNTAVETISRTMRYLDEKDLVTSLTPYRFWIRDIDVLAHIAGVEPPMLCLAERRGTKRMETHFGSPKSGDRMTAVNAAEPRANRFNTVVKPVSANTRGLARRRNKDVQEEIRD